MLLIKSTTLTCYEFCIRNNNLICLFVSTLGLEDDTVPAKLPKNADLSKPIPKRTG